MLHVLIEGSNSPTMDIIAVHGLNGHYMKTWTDRPKSRRRTMWLRDLLPEKLPGCRVMSFEYDASVSGMSTTTVRDAAGRIIQMLRDKRKESFYDNIPIVFIGHSLGGVVIKQALAIAERDYSMERTAKHIYGQDIAGCTKGIVFFGTPHRGADIAKWGAMIRNIARVVTCWPRPSFLDVLRRNSEDLYKISEDFLPLSSNYAIISFYEEYAIGIWGDVIVDKDSSVTGLPHEQKMMLSGDHRSICRFSRGDQQFETVWMRIEDAAAGRQELSATRSGPGGLKMR
ncbi:putative protein SERAC1 [Rosellinia necatrix]|uniref:DUF676 domain-containing protein n=1 Tax=Rosellinia necatrix TaxID=77044 RepID=A0A1S7UHB3_ROSNE|nr:putative protein SERAC1 [Rosellinia necatrix]